MKLARMLNLRNLYVPTFICLALLALLQVSCHKAASVGGKSSDELIAQDRDYFEHSVLPFHNPDTTVDLQHFRMALHKSPDWSRAYVDNLGAFGKTVTVPLRFTEQMHLSDEYRALSIDDMSYLLIHQDSTGNTH